VISRLGTAEILAPEILRREPSDYRVDIFAFGIVAYEVLTGHWPFESSEVHQTPMLKVLNVKPVPVEKRVPAVPAEVATMIMRCLEKETAKRPTNLNAVVSILARHGGAL
jgi:serine/threonine-protein kinase